MSVLYKEVARGSRIKLAALRTIANVHVSAEFLAEHGQIRLPAPAVADLLEVSRKLEDATRRAMMDIFVAPTVPRREFDPDALGRIFPSLDTAHDDLRKDILHLPLIHEPQATKAIASVLNADGDTQARFTRIGAFLRALKAPSAIQESFQELRDISAVQVVSEKPMGGRRADIVLQWPDTSVDNETARESVVVVIEAKFNHSVTKGQLPDIRKEARHQAAAKYDLVLLTLDGLGHVRNREWRPVSWLTLMRRWENERGEIPAAVRVVEQMIWEKISERA